MTSTIALDWGVMPVAPSIELRITRSMPPLAPPLESIVTRLWEEASATKRLFNGRVFSADSITPTMISGHWTEYRRVTAQMREPRLFDTLRVRSLAVCGVLRGPDGLLVGRRENNANYQPGLWQLPPAGSVDEAAATASGVCWRTAILAELREELGLGPDDVVLHRPIALVQHPSGVLDLGIEIETGLPAAELLERHARHGDGEYDQLIVVPPARLAEVVAERGGALTPTARLLTEALASMPRGG